MIFCDAQMLPFRFRFNVYRSYIENERRRKRREGTAMRDVSPDFGERSHTVGY